MKNYSIVKTYYKTKGSKRQILSTKKTENREWEDRRTFYTAQKNGDLYWVKEYTDKEYGGNLSYPLNILYEYYYTRFLKKINASVKVEGGSETFNTMTIQPVDAVEKVDNCIVYEYCGGYSPINTFRDKAWYEEAVKYLEVWARRFPVKAYDMCENNTLVHAENGNIDIKLIDFEYSEDRDPHTEDVPLRRSQIATDHKEMVTKAMAGNIHVFDVRHQMVLSEAMKYDKMLNIGARTGKLGIYLHSQGKDVTIQDISFDILDERVTAAGVKHMEADVQIPDTWVENEFECVIATEVIEHVEDYKKAVENMITWAKKRVIITTPVGKSFFDKGHKHFFNNSSFDFIRKKYRLEMMITKKDDIRTGQRCFYLEIDV